MGELKPPVGLCCSRQRLPPLTSLFARVRAVLALSEHIPQVRKGKPHGQCSTCMFVKLAPTGRCAFCMSGSCVCEKSSDFPHFDSFLQRVTNTLAALRTHQIKNVSARFDELKRNNWEQFVDIVEFEACWVLSYWYLMTWWSAIMRM